jgi:hypothetical protein
VSRVAHARAAIPWAVVLASALPGIVLVGVGIAFRDSDSALAPVRMGLMLLAVPSAFLLDDPSAGVSSATPRSPWWDLSSRMLALVAGCALIGALAWSWDLLVPTPQAWLLALVPVCAAIAGVAGAALMRRVGRYAPGDVVASVAGFLLLGLLIFTPQRGSWELLPWPGSAGVGDSMAWVVLGAVGALVLLWAPSGRGPRPAVDA